MTVEELIKKLKMLPQKAVVHVYDERTKSAPRVVHVQQVRNGKVFIEMK